MTAVAAFVPSIQGTLDRLAAVVSEVSDIEIGVLDEPTLRLGLAQIETASRRLEARQTRMAGELAKRRRAAAREKPGSGPSDAERAERQLRQELADELDWTPSRSKEATEVGRRLTETPELGEVFDTGHIPPRNAKLMTETLSVLLGDQRDRAEAILLEAAQREDPVRFGRTCRRLLAELDHDAAVTAEKRRHARRKASVVRTDDGMLRLSTELTGLDAEVVETAIHAFRVYDGPDDTRSPGQRTADALVTALRVALDAGEAPSEHGVRPHVMVTIDYQTILEGAGVAELGWAGPTPYAEVRRLLADAGVSRILTDPRGLPLEAGEAVRSVPAGLYKLLVLRDGGCIYEGCDTPAGWCQVMHLDVPFRKLGRLGPGTSALGCLRHHRAFDAGHLELLWEDGRPSLRQRRRTPADR